MSSTPFQNIRSPSFLPVAGGRRGWPTFPKSCSPRSQPPPLHPFIGLPLAASANPFHLQLEATFNFSSAGRSRQAACASWADGPVRTPLQAQLWFPAPRGIKQELGTGILLPPPGSDLMLPWSKGTGFPGKHGNMRRGFF